MDHQSKISAWAYKYFSKISNKGLSDQPGVLIKKCPKSLSNLAIIDIGAVMVGMQSKGIEDNIDWTKVALLAKDRALHF